MNRRVGYMVLVLLLGAHGAGCRSTAPRPPAPQSQASPAVAAPTPAVAPPGLEDVKWSALTGKTVLVMTRPTVPLLKSFRRLVAKKLIDVSDLFLVGAYHSGERHGYGDARKYVLEEGIPWMGFKRLSCKVDAQQVFERNPCTETFGAIAKHATGLVFNGGPDMPPQLYGEETLLTTAIRDPQRHYWEVSLLFHLLGSSRNPAHPPLLRERPQMPILAICLGLQHMNVATGGTMIQDIPSEVYGRRSQEAILKADPSQRHRNPNWALSPAGGITPGSVHSIRWGDDETLWRSLMGKGHPPAGGQVSTKRVVQVFSAHHQAVERLGQGLRVVATSMDGKIVEALTHRLYPNVLGVQFHPEFLTVWSPASEARISSEHPVHNVAASMLENDMTTRAFHVGLWRLFAERLKAEHLRRGTAQGT